MAAPTGAFVMRDASVKIGAVEYANQCTKVRLVPETPIQTVRTLVPDGVVQDVDSPVWTLELTCLQINDTGGLAKALRDADPGDELTLIFMPLAGSAKPMATATIIALPAPFGGDQGAFPTAEMVFPVKGAPVFGTSAV
jgi:hypothetical protein